MQLKKVLKAAARIADDRGVLICPEEGIVATDGYCILWVPGRWTEKRVVVSNVKELARVCRPTDTTVDGMRLETKEGYHFDWKQPFTDSKQGVYQAERTMHWDPELWARGALCASDMGAESVAVLWPTSVNEPMRMIWKGAKFAVMARQEMGDPWESLVQDLREV